MQLEARWYQRLRSSLRASTMDGAGAAEYDPGPPPRRRDFPRADGGAGKAAFGSARAAWYRDRTGNEYTSEAQYKVEIRKRQRTQGAAVPVPVAVPLQASPQAGVTIHRCSTGGTITGEQRLPPFLFSRTRCALHCCSRGPPTHRGAFSPDLRANPRRSDDQMEQEEVPGRGDSP